MDINRLSTDVGVTKMSKERYIELRNLNPLDVSGIKKSLIQRERALGHPENEIEENIKLIASGIKLRTFTDSRDPHVKWLGTKVRRLAVHELSLLDYTESEMAVIFDVSPYTIKRDIKSDDNIPSRQWWRKPSYTKKNGYPITNEWEITSPSLSHNVLDYGSCLNGDGK